MNTTRNMGIAMMALVFGLMLSPAIFNDAEAKLAKPDVAIQGVLAAPGGDTPFGGEVVGKYNISVRGDFTSITTSLNLRSSADTVYEGWLVDVDSGEKTSFGLLKESGQGLLSYLHVNIPNNFGNDLIVITEEPLHDVDPTPATPVGGAELGKTFR